MLWQVPKIWDEGEVWIIGGGSSIVKEFNIPSNIVNDVLNKKRLPDAYSPYMSQIHNKHVIGVNAAYLIGSWMSMIFFGDKGFFLDNMQNLSIYGSGLIIGCHPYIERFKWVKYLQRDNTKVRGLTNNPKKVSWNYNSGCAAINLAVHTGAKKIILLGFDMNLDNNKQHWHGHYREGGVRGKSIPFKKHLRPIPVIKKDADLFGVEIINASPTSAITEFRKASVKELL